MTIIQEYLDYTKKYQSSHGEKTLVLMQVGSFFECYALLLTDGTYKGSHIQEFANINDMIISKKNVCVGDYNVVMAGFGLPQLEKYIKKMLVNDYTVVVFTQDNQAKNTTRSLSCIYSPGTFFNNQESIDCVKDGNAGLSNNTICIWLHIACQNNIIRETTLTIGISIIDVLTGKLINYEYNHPYISGPSIYDQLEKFIAIYNPSEVIIITNNPEENFIELVISYANITCKKFHKIVLSENGAKSDFEKLAENCEKQKYQETLIDKIYGSGAFQEKAEFHEYMIANQSLCFLLDFVERHNPSLIKNINYPIFENHCDKLVLANHSLKQLNIISDQRHNGKLSCLATFLNNCITNAGRRRFNYDLLHPISNVEELDNAYNVTSHLLNTNFYFKIREYLKDVRDIEKIERKMIMRNINPRDFFILYNNLSKISELYQKILNDSENYELYNYIKLYIKPDIVLLCDKINNFILDKFNLDKTNNILMDKLANYNLEDLDFINKNYNLDLNIFLKNCVDSKEQFQAISHYFSQIISEFEKPKTSKLPKTSNSEINDTQYVKIHETSKNDAMLIATKRRVMILKECIGKIIQHEGQHIGIKYLSKYSGKEEILNLDLSTIEYKVHGNNQTNLIIFSGHINEIASAIQNSKEIFIDKLIHYYNLILREFFDLNNQNSINNLSIISQFIGLIDLCHCRAYNAAKYNYCKPTIQNIQENKSYFNFKKIRHPLIEHLNNKELYVTNDMELGTNNIGALLWGTNAVGKSSLIKSIGISIILAQAGMFVPCEEFIYYPYSYLFTRILGNDNIFKNLSTFAVEMCELRTILKMATKNSLVIGDEVCSGTESISALSIFTSCLEKLYNIESTFIFATHFHEILKYDEIKNMKQLISYHLSVIYDREKNTLIYDRKLKLGSGNNVYGLEVAKSLDLPDDFIERAYSIRNKYNPENNTTLDIKYSTFNSKKLREKICELCNKNPSCDVHHLQFQQNADTNGIINGEFHKNKKANLICLCKECHEKIHKENIQYRIVKSNDKYELLKI